MAVTTENFMDALDGAFRKAEENGEPFVDILSGNLHKHVGEYPGSNHRMRAC